MHICDYRLHRGYVYAMPPEARMTFVRMMDVESYLSKLLQMDAIREDLLKHFNRLNKVLRHTPTHPTSILTSSRLAEVTGS